MGLFSSKSKSSSTTTNQTTTVSQSLGDLSKGNIQASGDVTVHGFYGEDLDNFLGAVKDITGGVFDTTSKATSSNSNLAGQSIQQVAQAYQSAYSETTGMLQQLKPVLMVGISVVALFMIPKLWRKL